MVKSMTGYGRAESTVNNVSVSVEIKSVNHRFFEFSAKVPRNLTFLEERLKSFVQQRVSRGKIDLYVSVDMAELSGVEVSLNRPFVEGYVKALKCLVDDYGLLDDISVSSVSQNSEAFIIKKASVDEEKIWNAVLPVANKALDNFIAMREAEGKRLANDVTQRASFVLEKVELVEKASPETVRLYREKIEQKIKDLIGDVRVDEQRLLTETAIFADRVAVSEETVRLRSHIEQLTSMITEANPVGRKLDFVVQEMNREANTIGSKAQDVSIVRAVVDIKAEIEKIREQIQNIE